MEIVIVAIIVTTAIGLLALRAVRQLKAPPSRTCGCSADKDCTSCPVDPREQR